MAMEIYKIFKKRSKEGKMGWGTVINLVESQKLHKKEKCNHNM